MHAKPLPLAGFVDDRGKELWRRGRLVLYITARGDVCTPQST